MLKFLSVFYAICGIKAVMIYRKNLVLFCFVFNGDCLRILSDSADVTSENALTQLDTWRYGVFFVSFPSHLLSHCLQFLWQMS